MASQQDCFSVEWHKQLGFLDALTAAIEGTHILGVGRAVGAGLQFCQGQARAWVDYEGGEKVWFGDILPEGMVQEVRIDEKVLKKIRAIAGDSHVAKKKAKR